NPELHAELPPVQPAVPAAGLADMICDPDTRESEAVARPQPTCRVCMAQYRAPAPPRWQDCRNGTHAPSGSYRPFRQAVPGAGSGTGPGVAALLPELCGSRASATQHTRA